MKLAIILGSTRPQRQTSKLAAWVFNKAQKMPSIEAEMLDLQDYPLPFFDEPMSPRYNPKRQLSAAAQKWLTKLESFDAYIIVTPEYNHSIPAVLKNALDYIDWQISKKPLAIVSHGSAGGARAAGHLKQIISENRGVAISSNLALTMRIGEIFDENGTLAEEVAKQPHGPETVLQNLLQELQWYSDALLSARLKSV
ncbi:MAG TPA: NAD(P)H-dependent oxidoreductase [Candidatus Dormibacteraeota bacterium]|nr:NAD(P)H-dependent oxidoreductase [Candidatus Dormibacteraeota bacterium]